MKINCPACGQITTIAQEYQYHAGFGNQGFLYCDSCPTIIEFGSYNSKYTSIVNGKHTWSLDSEEMQCVEAGLKPCPCGGHFRFNALPRCPACNEPLPNLLQDKFHFVEVGRVVDADKEDAWT
ncbi:MAG: hypothetical protein ABL911_12560 [Gallionella sp.]